jgi:hypothetical protein
MYRQNPFEEPARTIFVLQHLETSEFVCLRQDGRENLAAFSNRAAAAHFRDDLGLVEFVEIRVIAVDDAPFEMIWLDGEMIARDLLIA